MSLKYLAAAAAVLTTALAAPSSRQAATKDIVELAAGNDSLEVLVRLVNLAGLGSTLKEKGPFTVFAPTDDAFAAAAVELGYPANDNDETIDSLTDAFTKLGASEKPSREAKAVIADVLKYHVLSGGYTFDDLLKKTSLTTLLEGKVITRGQDGVPNTSLTDLADDVPNPVIAVKDVAASNGVVHLIDSVLLPVTDAELKPAKGSGKVSETATKSPTTTVVGATTKAAGTAQSSPDDDDDDVCFPSSASVELRDGRVIPMSDVRIGDELRVGADAFSPVFMFTHKLASTPHAFIRVSTPTTSLTLTRGHYLYVNGALAAASSVAPGDVLTLASGAAAPVTAVASVDGTGLYNPQTLSGDIVVDGVLASTYTTAVEPAFAHAALAPLRALQAWVGLTALESGGGKLVGALPKGQAVLYG